MENNIIKEPRKQFSGIGLVMLIGTFVIYAVQIITLFVTRNVSAVAENGNLNFLVSMLPMYIIAYPIIFLMFKKVPVQMQGEKKKMRVHHFLAAFLICYAGMYICNFVANMITMVIGMMKQDAVDNVMVDLIGSIHPAVNFFIVVICAPIMEELLFRKMIVDRTAKYGEGVAVVFSGLLFGLFHGNLVQFAYAFLLGAFFAFIYIKTKNIKYTIFLHMLINFFGSFVSSLILEVSGYMDILDAMNQGVTGAELTSVMMDNIGGIAIMMLYMFGLFVLVISGIVVFFVNLKKFKCAAGELPIAKGQRFKTVILNVGVILYTMFWIVQIVLQLLR